MVGILMGNGDFAQAVLLLLTVMSLCPSLSLKGQHSPKPTGTQALQERQGWWRLLFFPSSRRMCHCFGAFALLCPQLLFLQNPHPFTYMSFLNVTFSARPPLPPCLKWQVAITHKNAYPPSLSIHYCIIYILLIEYTFCQSLPTKTDVPRRQKLSPSSLASVMRRKSGTEYTVWISDLAGTKEGPAPNAGGKVGSGL